MVVQLVGTVRVLRTVRVKVQLPAIGQTNEEPGQFLKPKMSTVVRIYNKTIPEFTAQNPKK